MICNRCGREINNISKFCPFCGSTININNDSININNTKQNNSNKNNFDKKQKTIIISLLSVIILLFGVILLVPDNNTRTVLIYIVGSNLETDAKIVTSDLAAIKPNEIDLSKTNILLYTGGTEKWHNFISSDDNGIYILKSNGFEKLESQEQYNLGDPKILTDFLRYGYDNYKADKYDLILYDHGGAIDGAIYDDISEDNLSLEDMSKALNDSPFNNKNKLEAVLFRTCLNGTIELANVFKDYSNYLIASEEISYGANYTNVLGFLNNVLPDDKGLDFGKKYVDAYDKQMAIINPLNEEVQTYSVVDLSKIDKLNEELGKYINELDISNNYKGIALVRSSLYQYGSSETEMYDMIDLYEFANKTSEYTSSGATKLLEAINQTVKYNKSNREDSHGISIYFPYNAKKGIKYKFLEIYENLNYSEEYKNFINTFNKMQQSPSGYSFNFSENKMTSKNDKTSFSMELTEEQLQTYSNGLFAIFERDSEHPNYYKPIFSSDDTSLENNVLSANINNKMLKIDDEDGNYEYILTYYRKRNNNSRTVNGVLYGKDLKFTDDGFYNSVIFSITDSNGNPVISSAKLQSKNERINGVLLRLEDYDKYEIWNNSYKILDESGNYTEEWEASPTATGYAGEFSKISLKNSGLDDNDNYYGLFILKDIYGNTSYSKLIKVGE